MLMKEIKDNLNKGGHTMFMNWKTQHRRDVNSPQTDLWFNANAIKITASLFFFNIDIRKLILKFTMERHRP